MQQCFLNTFVIVVENDFWHYYHLVNIQDMDKTFTFTCWKWTIELWIVYFILFGFDKRPNATKIRLSGLDTTCTLSENV